MYKRQVWKVVGVWLFSSTLWGCQYTPDRPPPNVIVILADDLGYMDVGAYNPQSFYETPHLDRLAQEGIRFTDAYAAAPVCSPTRASIMAGKYPARMHTTDWFGAPQPETIDRHWTRNQPLLPAAYVEQLPHEEASLAEAFREAGYRTLFAGKWHLGKEGSYPEDHGFEINKGGWERGGPYGGDKYFSPYGNPKLDDGPAGEHLPARLAQETVAFIQAEDERPFFAFLSFYSVHTPLLARPDLQAKYEAKATREDAWGREGMRKVRLVQNHAVYAAMVEAMDEAIGDVMLAIDSLGLAEQTIILFTSDNGGLSTSEGHPTANVPLRAGKGWLYEGGIREPFIVRWAGRIAGGQTSPQPVISTDIYPTLLDLAGLELRPEQHMDGVSLAPIVKEEGVLGARNLYWHYPHYGNQGGSPSAALRTGDWKLVYYWEDNRAELYNLGLDISESNNLAESEPVRVAEMLEQLRAWQQSVNARMPAPNPAATLP